MSALAEVVYKVKAIANRTNGLEDRLALEDAAVRIEKLSHALTVAELGWSRSNRFDEADKAMIDEALR